MGLQFRLLSLLSLACCAAASMYCGDENCYDVLQITQQATDNEIKKAYRKLSLEVHPDKNKSPDAPAKFQRVATAYEILSDPESRRDFDYALAHPEERMYNQYRYYRQQYKKTVQADVRLVVGGALVIFSALQVRTSLLSPLRLLVPHDARTRLSCRRIRTHTSRIPRTRAKVHQETQRRHSGQTGRSLGLQGSMALMLLQDNRESPSCALER